MAKQQEKVQDQDINQLRKVRREKLADLQSNGKNPFEITKFDVTCHAMDIKEHFEELEGAQVTLAGRIMQKRVMGKASFCNVLDQSGDIQSYVARDSIGVSTSRKPCSSRCLRIALIILERLINVSLTSGFIIKSTYL